MSKTCCFLNRRTHFLKNEKTFLVLCLLFSNILFTQTHATKKLSFVTSLCDHATFEQYANQIYSEMLLDISAKTIGVAQECKK